MIVDQSLKVVDVALVLIQDDVVVNRASSTLDSGVGAKIEVVFKRMCDIAFDQSAGKGVVVSIGRTRITFLRKETDVMTLGAYSNGPFDLQKSVSTQI